MAKQNINSKEGFTIIEVVLVLAIAGLIFLMVFVALPALQRSQRDTARRNDMSRVDTSLVQYQTNHNTSGNNLPASGTFTPPTGNAEFTFPSNCSSSTACAFVRDYMNTGADATNKTNEFTDPDGVAYGMVITSNYATNSTLTNIKYNDKSTLITATGTGTGKTGYTIGGSDPFGEHVVYVVPGGKCDNDVVIQAEKRHFAILYRLEGAGVYCIDDQ